jgi:hypothetical protein
MTYFARLAEIERRAAADDRQLSEISQRLLALQREALVTNPLVSGQPILFVVRPQYSGNHGPINTTFENGEVASREPNSGYSQSPMVSVWLGSSLRAPSRAPTHFEYAGGSQTRPHPV